MNRIIFSVILFISIFCSCTPGKHLTDQSANNQSIDKPGKDGSSFEKAIVIKEKTETAGVAAEYSWLREHYPGYNTKEQQLVYNNNLPFDVLIINTAAGEEKKIYFDISNFFGKF